jgi:tetratricopeptide (TPR) repeat protein
MTLGSTLSSSSITKTALSKIKIPYGSHAIDAYLCDRTNIDKFKEKGDNWGNPFSYIIKGSAENTTQGLIRVNNVTSGTYYIGLKNPSLTNAVDIIIEGVAIIASEETFQQSDEQGKAVLYGNMGWKAFEKGEYEKCLEYSQKAIQLDPTLAWVKLNISLTYLVQEKPEYLDSYIDAILACKKSDHPKEFLQAGLKDIYDIKNKRTLKKSDEEVIELITNELSRLK